MQTANCGTVEEDEMTKCPKFLEERRPMPTTPNGSIVAESIVDEMLKSGETCFSSRNSRKKIQPWSLSNFGVTHVDADFPVTRFPWSYGRKFWRLNLSSIFDSIEQQYERNQIFARNTMRFTFICFYTVAQSTLYVPHFIARILKTLDTKLIHPHSFVSENMYLFQR